MRVQLSVVICSYNGAAKLADALSAIRQQTVFDQIEVIVVDDGSRDETAQVASRYDWVRVIRHQHNRGLAAARNTGLAAAQAEWVAFTDDDCRPAPDWAESLIEQTDRHSQAFAVGGPVSAIPASGVINAYLRAKPPLTPLELSLLADSGFWHRLREYLHRSASTDADFQSREVAALPGANMAVRKDLCLALGGWDDTFTFGGEEEELFRRALEKGHQVRCEPHGVVFHDFENTLRDLIRRSFLYGRGNERLQAKHGGLPTLYPLPALTLALIPWARRPIVALVLLVLPQAAFSVWPREALTRANPTALVFPYLQLVQEFASNVGWVLARVRRVLRAGKRGGQ